jgi:(p)ppGpp synthase/HD superfamily hydrolase
MNDNSKTLIYWINLAKQIAIKAHSGQFRNDKITPYIKHPIEVAEAVEDRLKPIALMHDSIEDSRGVVTLDTLREAGFPQYIIDAVEVLTHMDNEPNVVYWNKILKNPDAVIVKIADINANLGGNPTQYAKDKYARALKLFAAAGYSV